MENVKTSSGSLQREAVCGAILGEGDSHHCSVALLGIQMWAQPPLLGPSSHQHCLWILVMRHQTQYLAHEHNLASLCLTCTETNQAKSHTRTSACH